MTKAKLIDVILQRSNEEHLGKFISHNRNQLEKIIDFIFEMMGEALSKGKRIEIRQFGSWDVRYYESYEGRNPKTNELVHVNAKWLPFFKAGKLLKEEVNSKK